MKVSSCVKLKHFSRDGEKKKKSEMKKRVDKAVEKLRCSVHKLLKKKKKKAVAASWKGKKRSFHHSQMKGKKKQKKQSTNSLFVLINTLFYSLNIINLIREKNNLFAA